jgi:hypothetical protein
MWYSIMHFYQRTIHIFPDFLLPQFVLKLGLQEAEAFANDVLVNQERKLED